MDKNVRKIHIDNENDLFKVLTELSILSCDHGYIRPQNKNDNNKNEKIPQPHECVCKKAVKDEDAVRCSVLNNKRIALPVVDAIERQCNIAFPDIKASTIEDFLKAINKGEVNSVIINTGNIECFVSIPFDMIDDFVEWLTDIKTLIKTKTHYFDEPVKMTRAEIEKALGHKFIICD